jgi:altronate hydrolase/altronate dehydratase small subunit
MSAGESNVTAMVLNAEDDVAVLLGSVEAGDTVVTLGAREGLVLTPAASVPAGHKLALRDLPAGTDVRKYGEVVGRLETPVAAGGHVHVHNLKSLRAH